VDTSEGSVRLRVGEGVMPGDHAGPRLFNNTYCRAMTRAFRSYAAKSETACTLVVASPFDGRRASVGATGFVDDIGATILGKSIAQVVRESDLEQFCVKQQTDKLGIALHEGKQENVIDVAGVGSKGVPAKLYCMVGMHGRNTNDARYLGGRQVYGLAFGPERKLRLVAMQKGWAMLGRFWTSRSPFKVRRSAFICMVVSAALSGLEACAGMFGPLRSTEFSSLETQMLKYLRAMMKGTASGRETVVNDDGGRCSSTTACRTMRFSSIGRLPPCSLNSGFAG